MNAGYFKCCQSILRAFIGVLFLKLLKLGVKNMKEMHGNCKDIRMRKIKAVPSNTTPEFWCLLFSPFSFPYRVSSAAERVKAAPPLLVALCLLLSHLLRLDPLGWRGEWRGRRRQRRWRRNGGGGGEGGGETEEESWASRLCRCSSGLVLALGLVLGPELFWVPPISVEVLSASKLRCARPLSYFW